MFKGVNIFQIALDMSKSSHLIKQMRHQSVAFNEGTCLVSKIKTYSLEGKGNGVFDAPLCSTPISQTFANIVLEIDF